MSYLSYEQLDTSLQRLCVGMYSVPQEFTDAMKVYYLTGIRSAELLERGLWEDLDEHTIILHPLKSNNPRYISKVLLPSEFLEYILNGTGNLRYLTERKLSYFMRVYYEYPRAAKGMKESALYLFRYRYVKALFKDGLNETQVQDHMGWKNSSLPMRYNNAQIVV